MSYRYVEVPWTDVPKPTREIVATALAAVVVDELEIPTTPTVRYFKNETAKDEAERRLAGIGLKDLDDELEHFTEDGPIRGKADWKSETIWVNVDAENTDAHSLSETVAHECAHLTQSPIGSGTKEEHEQEASDYGLAFADRFTGRDREAEIRQTYLKTALTRAYAHGGRMGYGIAAQLIASHNGWRL